MCGTNPTASDYAMQRPVTQSAPPPFVRVNNPQPYQPGDAVAVTLGGPGSSSRGGSTAAVTRLVWYPPPGVEEITFGAVQPEPGGPPFVFQGMTPDALAQGIEIVYTAPARVGNGETFSDATEIFLDNGERFAAKSVHAFAGSDAARLVTPQRESSAWDEIRASEPISVTAWDLYRFVDPKGITLTTQLCQEYVRQGQTNSLFVAWRVPITGTILPGQAYPLPIIANEEKSPNLAFYGLGTSDFEMSLELRWDAMHWAEQNLPSAPGETWLALGIDRSQTLTCPEHLYSPADRWSYLINATLNLSHLPDACADCELVSYGCYRAQPGERLTSALAFASLHPGQVRRYSEGVVCAGPSVSTLTAAHQSGGPDLGWKLYGLTLMTSVTATHPITLDHWVENNTQSAQTLTIDVASDLSGAVWRAYRSIPQDPAAIDLSRPLGDQIDVLPGGYPNADNHIWLVADAPADAQGAYTVTLTLSNPALTPASSRKMTNIWVGGAAEIVPAAPAVTVKMSASPATVQPGGLLTYTLTVINDGALPLHDLVITDTLPAHTAFVRCTGGDECALDGAQVRWELASLAAGLSRSLRLVVTVDEDAPPGSNLRNTDYRVTAREEVAATGPAVETAVEADASDWGVYLPLMIK